MIITAAQLKTVIDSLTNREQLSPHWELTHFYTNWPSGTFDIELGWYGDGSIIFDVGHATRGDIPRRSVNAADVPILIKMFQASGEAQDAFKRFKEGRDRQVQEARQLLLGATNG
jgi:hypothetical protein